MAFKEVRILSGYSNSPSSSYDSVIETQEMLCFLTISSREYSTEPKYLNPKYPSHLYPKYSLTALKTIFTLTFYKA